MLAHEAVGKIPGSPLLFTIKIKEEFMVVVIIENVGHYGFFLLTYYINITQYPWKT
jgi:hypothetical protein